MKRQEREASLMVPRALLRQLLGLKATTIAVWFALLEHMRYDPEPVHHCNQWIIVAYGQLLANQKEIESWCELSRNTVENALEQLGEKGVNWLEARAAVPNARSKTMFTMTEPHRWIYPGKNQRQGLDLVAQNLNHDPSSVPHESRQNLNHENAAVPHESRQNLNHEHTRARTYMSTDSESDQDRIDSDQRACSGLDPDELLAAGLLVADLWPDLTGGLPFTAEPLPGGLQHDKRATARNLIPMLNAAIPADIVPPKPRTMEQLAETVGDWIRKALVRIGQIPFFAGRGKRNGNGAAWRCSLEWLAQGEPGDPGARLRKVVARKYDPNSWRYAKGEPVAPRREQAVSQQQVQEA